MAKYVIPYLRSFIANFLINELGLTQTEAAKKMNVTQAAISQYLKQKRGKKKLVLNKKIEEKIKAFAFMITQEGVNDKKMQEFICGICKEMFGD